jgi:hypothetical protein
LLDGRQTGLKPATLSLSLDVERAGHDINFIAVTGAFALMNQRDLVTRSLKAPRLTRKIGMVTRSGQSLSSVAPAFADLLPGIVQTRDRTTLLRVVNG